MKKRSLSGLLVLMLLSIPALACDVCSCGSMAFGAGDWFNQGRSRISLAYNLRSFEAPLSVDQFHQINTTGIWAFQNNWQLKVGMPYIIAERESNETLESLKISGIGDISLSLQKQIWNHLDNESEHKLYLSAGVQMPTGDFVDRPIESVFSPNFQAGSASWDLLLGLQYEFAWKKMLLVFQSAHLQNTTNRFDYRFGDQWTNSLKIARNIKLQDKVGSLLYLNVDHEYLGRDVNKRGYYQFGTGGSAWFSGVGYQVIWTNWSLGAQFQFRPFPASGHYQALNQLNANLTYFF